jgi:nickel transport protein
VAAHKLNVFAAAEGRRIQGEVYFAGGAKAAAVPVLVQNATGKTLAELRSGADGRFAYEAAAAVTHTIVAETPDGHRATWRIDAAELAAAFAQARATVERSNDGPEPAAADSGSGRAAGTGADRAGGFDDQPDSPTTEAAADPALDPALAAAIERAVARQVRPLREEALAAREAVQLRDVLGGLGYILGLAGLGLWWRCRRGRTGT